MKFERLNIKHFAELATNNGVFGSAQASLKNEGIKTTDYNQIASMPAFKEGWNSATLTTKALPPLEEMQGLESYLSYLINYLYQQGIPTWDANYTYYVGNIVAVVDSRTNKVKLYSSLSNDNTGNDPATSTDNWAPLPFFTQEFQDLLSAKMDRSPPQVNSNASGDFNLQANTCYYLDIQGDVNFILPQTTNSNYEWIRIRLYMGTVSAINLGTTHFYSGGTPDMADPGFYLLLYGNTPFESGNTWVCDAIGPSS